MPQMTPRSCAPRHRSARIRLAFVALAAVAVAAVGAAQVPRAAASPAATGSTVPGRCTQYEDELRRDTPPGGWDVLQMSAYMARESSCSPTARSARDTGLLQINDINHTYLRMVLGEWVGRWSLTDPVQNIRAAAALCEYWRQHGESCYFPWKLDLYRPPAAAAAAGSTASAATAASTESTPSTVATGSSTSPTVPAASTSGRCVPFEAVLAANAPKAGWDVSRMSRLMFTTSGCDPTRRWSTATGLLRISDSNQVWLRLRLRATVNRLTLSDPVQNVRAAAALCQLAVDRGGSCYQPWQG